MSSVLAAMRECRWGEAIAYFNKAMSVTKGVHLVALLNLIGVCRYTQGRPDDALRDFEESARLALESGARRGGAQALNSIGLINRDNGDLDTALRLLEESLAIAREFDDQWAVAIQLGNIGNVWHDRGDLDQALELHEQAFAIASEIGDRWSVASELANIGGIHRDKGDLGKALKYDEAALAEARRIGYRLGAVTGPAAASPYRPSPYWIRETPDPSRLPGNLETEQLSRRSRTRAVRLEVRRIVDLALPGTSLGEPIHMENGGVVGEAHVAR